MTRKTTIRNEVFAKVQKYTLEENIENGFAQWGKYDDLPKKLMRVATDAVDENGLTEGSTWHTACIEGIVKNIIADGLASETGALPTQINNMAETPNELFEKLAYDFKTLRLTAIEVIWTPGSVVEGITGLEIAEMYHIPASNVRAKERNERGYIEGWYVSKFFGQRSNKIRKPDEDERVEFMPSFNPNTVQENLETERPAQMKQILIISVPSRDGGYYPEPDYKGGLTDIFTDSLLRKARVSNLNNGIIAGLVMQIAGIPSDEKLEAAFMKDLDDKILSAQNAGTPIILKKPEGDQHIIGAPVSIGDTTDTSKDFDDDLRVRIFSSHGVTSARVLGIKEDGSVFDSNQIMEEFLVFITLTIRPLQMKMLSGLNKLAPYITGVDNFVINPIQLAEAIEDGVADDVEDAETDTNDETITP